MIRCNSDNKHKYISSIAVFLMFWVFVVAVVSSAFAQSQRAKDLKDEFSFQSYQQQVGNELQSYQALDAQQLEKYHEFKMEREKNRLIHVLVLSVVAIGSLALVLYRLGLKEPVVGRQIVSLTGLVLIIYGTIVLTLMAETEQQLTAAIGILGAVAGYLFGTIRTPAAEQEKAAQQQEKVPERAS